jgi:hypothetical protein
MKQDRFLMGILIFIGVLVVAALALFFIRKDSQAYDAEDSPVGVIRNYALALQKQDFARAYSYLADEDGKPDYETFRKVFLSNQLDFSSNAVQVGKVQFMGGGEATVSVTVLYAGSGPFNEGWSSADTASLVQQGSAWKLISMAYPYWSYDWYQVDLMPTLAPKP